MFINIDKGKNKGLILEKFDLLVYCYGLFRSLDQEKGYYTFNTDSLLEDMNIKNNDRNWRNIDDTIENLDRKGKIFPYYPTNDDSYSISLMGYEQDRIYFRLYKHEFDLLIDSSKSLSENAKSLHYYCWILSHLDLMTQTFSMSYKFINDGYGSSDKTAKKYNDELVKLGLISVTTEYQDGKNTTSLYKRLYSEEAMVEELNDMDEDVGMDEIEEEILEDVEIEPTVYVNLDADEPIEKIKKYTKLSENEIEILNQQQCIKVVDK